MKFIDKLERKFGKYAIPQLVTKLAYIYSAVFIALFLLKFSQPSAYDAMLNSLVFAPGLILKGQIWRIVTFLFIPGFSATPINALFLFFVVRFMIFIGDTLENYWGTFKLNLYYLAGILTHIVISFATGYPIYSSSGLHLSIFLACAFIAGEYSIHLWGILPIKMKYLAYLDFAFILSTVIRPFPVSAKLLAVAPLVPYFLFFGKDIYYIIVNKKRSTDLRKKHSQTIYSSNAEKPKIMHTCEVCGVTNVSDPNMEFRYCSKCSGLHEYCIKHINNHTHV